MTSPGFAPLIYRPERALTRRGFLLSVGASTALTTACNPLAQQGGPQSPAREPVALEYLTTLSAYQKTNYETLIVQAFEQAHAPHRVSVVLGDSSYSKLKTLLAAGTPPDVTWWAFPEAYLANLIQDVTPLVRRDRYNVGVFPKAPFEDLATWGGRILGLPSQSGGNWPVLPYNKEIFRQAGVPEPSARWGDPSWTAQSWLEALRKTTKRGQDGQVATYGMSQIPPGAIALHWGKMWNGSWVSDDFQRVTCDSPQMIEAMEYLVSITGRHEVMATPARLEEAFGSRNAEQAFLSGKLAMYPIHGGGTSAVAQGVREQNLPLAFAPIPTMKVVYAGEQVTPNGLPVGIKNPEVSWQLVKWLADTPNWAISRAITPARVDHFAAWAKEVYPGIESQVRLDVYRDALKFAGRTDPIFRLPTFRDMYTTHIAPAITRFYAGETNVTTILKEIKALLEAMLPKDLKS